MMCVSFYGATNLLYILHILYAISYNDKGYAGLQRHIFISLNIYVNFHHSPHTPPSKVPVCAASEISDSWHMTIHSAIIQSYNGDEQGGLNN